ncbi:preprotein translocase subunit SecG [Methylosinus sp. Ce-a6]|uniref:preprotein translocase subunit SecG n=1 Tax=Methylosinus sp. Ce-a6 TaxID=2172005 RepID=UPI0013597E2F|nr:preprotein translocase subunit SecG [Methylosinus sp. Ce-a6]
MQQVIIVIHLMVVVALVVLILYQKSEGGALGIGGGGLFTGRGQANALTRATGILGAIFFLTSIALTVLPAWERGGDGLDPAKLELKEVPATGAPATAPNAAAPADKKESIFEQLQRAQQQRQGATSGATPPAAEQPAAPAPEAAPATPPAPEGAKAPEAKAPAEGADKAPAEQR